MNAQFKNHLKPVSEVQSSTALLSLKSGQAMLRPNSDSADIYHLTYFQSKYGMRLLLIEVHHSSGPITLHRFKISKAFETLKLGDETRVFGIVEVHRTKTLGLFFSSQITVTLKPAPPHPELRNAVPLVEHIHQLPLPVHVTPVTHDLVDPFAHTVNTSLMSIARTVEISPSD